MDELIDPAVVARLRAAVTRVAPLTDPSALLAAEGAVVGRRLRERVDVVRDALLHDLPADFTTTERIANALLEVPEFAGWMIWPASEWVVRRALDGGSEADFDSAMALLAGFTAGLTGEFAVRDLLIARPERGLEIMETWTRHPDEHVRRLASEGSRPFLPWARRVPWLTAHPEATRGILDGLYRDGSEYVRRSVANHLNDLSRIDPSVATRTAARWAGDPDGNTGWVLRHGLRTLIKRGDRAALELAGFTGGDLQVDRPVLAEGTVAWNGTLTFRATVTNTGTSDANVAIDYSIGFRRADGSVRPRTFKMAPRRIAAGERVVVTRTHSFRPITTRTHHPGRHFVTVQANGVVSQRADFSLEADRSGSAVRRSLDG